MMHNRYLIIICAVLMSLCMGVKAQAPADSIPYGMLELEGKLLLFVDKLNAIAADVAYADIKQLDKADKELLAVDNRWTLFTQAYQLDIASDEILMNITVRYQENKQLLADTILSRRHMLESKDAFLAAEHYINKQKEPYQKMLTEAQRLSQLEKLAPMLEKLKVKEQLAIEEIDKHYESARSVAQEFAALQGRMQKLEETYIELKALSDSIQAAEYKPFIERIKDYLLGFAAVAVILMFVNMVQSKIQAYKQLKKSAEDYMKAVRGGDDDIPSI